MLEQVAYRIGRGIARIILRTHNIHAEKLPEINGNFIVIANHSNLYDPAVLMTACKKTAYFVVGEDLYRKRNIRFIERLYRPIFICQGGDNSLAAMREIYSRINNGENIMMFPEGHYSYNTRTEELSPSTAGFIKMLGCTLVTYRIEGGYYNYPYWASTFRNGPMNGSVSGVYSSEQLSLMSDDELNELIRNDLYTDADVYQEQTGYLYPGIRLAEGLENVLSICPVCGNYNSIYAHGDIIECRTCGRSTRYTSKGILARNTDNEGFPFDRVSKWQTFIEDKIQGDLKCNSLPEIKYENVTLFRILPDHIRENICCGSLTVTAKEMHICKKHFSFDDIKTSIVLYRGSTLLFTSSDGYFGISSDRLSARLIETIIKGGGVYGKYRKDY